MVNPSTPSGEQKPFRVWIARKHVHTIDVLADDTWQAKAFAEEHREQWIEVDAETNVEEVRLHLGADFRAANES